MAMRNMIIEEILSVYNRTQSVKAVTKETGCGWQRVVKILSSNGIILNDTHGLILKLQEEGKSIEEISRQVGYSVKTVQAYIPAVRPFYNVNPSENAQKIKKYRERKKLKN